MFVAMVVWGGEVEAARWFDRLIAQLPFLPVATPFTRPHHLDNLSNFAACLSSLSSLTCKACAMQRQLVLSFFTKIVFFRMNKRQQRLSLSNFCPACELTLTNASIFFLDPNDQYPCCLPLLLLHDHLQQWIRPPWSHLLLWHDFYSQSCLFFTPSTSVSLEVPGLPPCFCLRVCVCASVCVCVTKVCLTVGLLCTKYASL